ncbi:MAG TPA: 30S ribosomal protein S12 methylthiotransferase RimO, partial [Leptospiraceae bacterium]|nr:30S ribosomal protein S12 methylthiotransferase RimO [Leptospiraceae bacterium]
MGSAAPGKSFFITTLGCPKNVADSEHVRLSLMSEGLEEAKSPDRSDFHLINTCTFIQSATEETIDTIIQAGKIKKKRKQKLIVLGCFAERYSDAIRSDIPEVDLSFGTGKYSSAGSILKSHFPEEFNGLQEINRD